MRDLLYFACTSSAFQPPPRQDAASKRKSSLSRARAAPRRWRCVDRLVDLLFCGGGLGAQRQQVLACLAGALQVGDDACVLLHRASERLEMTPEAGIDSRRPQLREGFPAGVRVLDLRTLDADMAVDEGVDGSLAVASRGGEQVDAERLVGLARHVFGYPLPQALAGDRGDVADRLPVPLGLVHRPLGNDGPGDAAAAALGHVGGE